ncbi:hypothetical protein C1H46_044312 [Malus baccata]|uniref:Uncharacterized protein n=1 Tax=Malus baccata TaxID=106549 RepID=A0A540K7F9_MALBA|nr:hypothetical protein C1H46_044312 [Malus baccata]
MPKEALANVEENTVSAPNEILHQRQGKTLVNAKGKRYINAQGSTPSAPKETLHQHIRKHFISAKGTLHQHLRKHLINTGSTQRNTRPSI